MSVAPAGVDTLHEVIDALAPMERLAGADAERRAAEWLAGRLRVAGCAAEVQEERFLDGYAGLMCTLSAASLAAGVVGAVGAGPAGGAAPGAGRRRTTRRLAGIAAAVICAAIADDISNGPRVVRRLTSAPRTTWNVVGACGDEAAPRTLVVLAHHDAARTGAIFDDRLQAWLGERFPGVLERIDTSIPLWWTLLAAPALVAAGALRDRPRALAAGIAASAIGVAAFADIARSPVVPGANDNLSGVAVLVALAERLGTQPVPGLRVLLASCGAEEVIQGGIYGFARRHFPRLDRDRTWFLNLETVGSPRLVMLEGEGPVVMEDYHDRSFRDRVARAAERAGAPVQRGLRARTSTDAVVPSRAGYPTATLASMNRYKALSNYHLMSDIPENIDYRTVAQALTVTEAVARDLAADPWIGARE